MIDVREYLNQEGCSPYEVWFSGLSAQAAAKVAIALARLSQGNFSMSRAWGPAYLSAGLTSALATEFISVRTETAW